ncbi:unnamed protein product [Closterium sp. Yama58-4]|nr:unnamed protein product [Closterium sp. Yama58-4]
MACLLNSVPSLRPAVTVLLLSVKAAVAAEWFSEDQQASIRGFSDIALKPFSSSLAARPASLSDWLDESPGLPHADVAAEEQRALGREVDPGEVMHDVAGFLPTMKLVEVCTALTVQPGFHVLTHDFLVSHHPKPQQKLRFFSIRADFVNSSATLVSPPQASIMLNAKEVPNRTAIDQDRSPLVPSDVIKLLRLGVNILNLMGRLSVPYIFVVACCDYSSVMAINERKPMWKCPTCGADISATSLCIDNRMVQVLSETTASTDQTDVLLFPDGSWQLLPQANRPASLRVQQVRTHAPSHQARPPVPSHPLASPVAASGTASLATAIPATAAPASATHATTTPATANPTSATSGAPTPVSATPATAIPASATPATAIPASATPATAIPASATPASATPGAPTPAVGPIQPLSRQLSARHLSIRGSAELASLGRSLAAVAASALGDRHGRNVLHYAAAQGRAELLRVLIQRGGNVNSRDCLQMTPLHFAAAAVDSVVAEILLEKGADSSALDASGLTPLDYAVRYGSLACEELLRSTTKCSKDSAEGAEAKRTASTECSARYPMATLDTNVPLSSTTRPRKASEPPHNPTDTVSSSSCRSASSIPSYTPSTNKAAPAASALESLLDAWKSSCERSRLCESQATAASIAGDLSSPSRLINVSTPEAASASVRDLCTTADPRSPAMEWTPCGIVGSCNGSCSQLTGPCGLAGQVGWHAAGKVSRAVCC